MFLSSCIFCQKYPALIIQQNNNLYRCDTILGSNWEKYPIQLDWKFTIHPTRNFNKRYYELFDYSESPPKSLGLFRIKNRKIFFLFNNFSKIPKDDSGSKEQIFINLNSEVGSTTQLKGFGPHLPYHELTLLSKSYDRILNDTIYSYSASWILHNPSHSNAINYFSFGFKTGFVEVKFESLNEEDQFCKCLLQR